MWFRPRFGGIRIPTIAHLQNKGIGEFCITSV